MPDTSTRAHSRLAFSTPGASAWTSSPTQGHELSLLELAEAKGDEDFQFSARVGGPGPPKQNFRPQLPRGAEVPSLDRLDDEEPPCGRCFMSASVQRRRWVPP